MCCLFFFGCKHSSSDTPVTSTSLELGRYSNIVNGCNCQWQKLLPDLHEQCWSLARNASKYLLQIQFRHVCLNTWRGYRCDQHSVATAAEQCIILHKIKWSLIHWVVVAHAMITRVCDWMVFDEAGGFQLGKHVETPTKHISVSTQLRWISESNQRKYTECYISFYGRKSRLTKIVCFDPYILSHIHMDMFLDNPFAWRTETYLIKTICMVTSKYSIISNNNRNWIMSNSGMDTKPMFDKLDLIWCLT